MVDLVVLVGELHLVLAEKMSASHADQRWLGRVARTRQTSTTYQNPWVAASRTSAYTRGPRP
jgi:hypothetical protein